MDISFFELEEWEKEYFRERLKKNKLTFHSGKLTVRNAGLASKSDAICIFIHSSITKKILDKLPRLKLICAMSTGIDHIDLAECSKRGIAVKNVPTYGENTVAEHTFALILALSRKLFDSIERVKKFDFRLGGLRGFDLCGKTIGVIGTGHIGSHVIRIAKGFEMNVIAYSKHKDASLAKKLGFSYSSLENLLKSSDIISIHCPLSDEARHMISMSNIKLIKHGAILVNTARGAIIDTKALVYALDKGILSGAGLDVLEGEPNIIEEKQMLNNKLATGPDLDVFIENHLLLKEKNVIITPHNAFNSREALSRILEQTICNIQAKAAGKKKQFCNC